MSKTHVDIDQDLADAWDAQIVVSPRFLRVRSLDKALRIMSDKPIGYYAFTKPEGDDEFAVLLRERGNTIRYNIRPNEDYTAYIISTLEGKERRHDSIDELVEQWDSPVDYDMNRKIETDDVAQNHGNLDSSEVERVRTRHRGPSLDDNVYAGVAKGSDGPSNHGSRETQRYRSPPLWADERHPNMDRGEQSGSQAVRVLLENMKLSENSPFPGMRRRHHAKRLGQGLAPQLSGQEPSIYQVIDEEAETGIQSTACRPVSAKVARCHCRQILVPQQSDPGTPRLRRN